MKSFSKKVLSSVFAALMLSAVMTGCNAASSESGDSSDSAVFKIGAMGPLTGDNASYGISVKQGAQLAVDEINAAGGVEGMTLELLFEDDELDEEKAVSAYNKVMDQGANVIMGAVTTGCCIAVTEESVQDNILQITPSGSGLECTQYDNCFRVCFTDPMQGRMMAEYIKEQGYSNAAIIYDVSSDYSTGIKDAFVETFTAAGGTIAAEESFTAGDVDFKTQLTKIKSSGADCLFLPIYYAEVGYISEQAPTVGLSLPYFGCDGWDGVIAQLDGNTQNIEGAAFLTPFVATSEQQNVKDFVAAYEDAYGSTPDQFAADGYDCVYAIYEALQQIDGVADMEPAELCDALIAVFTSGDFAVDGLTGSGMTWQANGEVSKDPMVVVIEDGVYVQK